jgi:hypothetical protein
MSSSYDHLSPEQLMAISLAVLDFDNSKRKVRVRKNNQPDPIQLDHEQKKQRIRKLYEAGKTESLRRVMQGMLDDNILHNPGLEAYIMEKTGYAIDTQADVKEQVLPVLERGYIITDQEYRYVWMLHITEPSLKEAGLRDQLKKMIRKYRRTRPAPPVYFRQLFEVLSPDGCYCVRVFESGSDEDWADTSIDVSFKRNGLLMGGGGFCTIYGTDINLEFAWQDNHALEIIHPGDAIFNSQWTDINFGERALKIIYTTR